MPERYLKIVTPDDNVATLLREVEAGEVLDIEIGDEVVSVTVQEDVRFGHKIAVTDIDAGDTIVKYGKSIGNATENIGAGVWVHVHNVDSNYGRGDLADTAAQAIHE